ncbi:MAG: iron ABC transporter permease [Candidatus Ozemobacteraceae bacterium]
MPKEPDSKALHTSFQSRHRRPLIFLAVCAVLLATFAAISLGIGHYGLGMGRLFDTIAGKVVLAEEQLFVLTQIRIPRILSAILVGGALAAAGTAMQAVFRNPLVSPFVLGISNGATLGAAIGIVYFNGMPWVTELLAFAFGLLAAGSAFVCSGMGRNTVTLLLFGMIVSSFAHALIGVMQYLSDTDNRLPALTFWMLGGLDGMSPEALAYAAPLVIICLAVLLVHANTLNLLSLGDRDARLLGIKVFPSKSLLLCVSTLMVSTCTAKVGVIGWIGLIVPHACRAMIGADNRLVLPLSIILGGIFLLAADDLARVIVAGELPVGILTALIGSPLFAILLWRNRHVAWN